MIAESSAPLMRSAVHGGSPPSDRWMPRATARFISATIFISRSLSWTAGATGGAVPSRISNSRSSKRLRIRCRANSSSRKISVASRAASAPRSFCRCHFAAGALPVRSVGASRARPALDCVLVRPLVQTWVDSKIAGKYQQNQSCFADSFSAKFANNILMPLGLLTTPLLCPTGCPS